MAKYRIFKRTEKSKDFFHEVNEDHFMIAEYSLMNDETLTLLVVTDGMGGLMDGDKASYYAIKGFMKSIYEKVLDLYLEEDNENFSLTHYIDRLQAVIKAAIKDANTMVCDSADPFSEIGTTISVVAILGGCAVVANTGDSPVYYYRQQTDEFSLVSQLHTRAELNVHEGKYKRYSEEYYQDDHVIYKSLGYREHLLDEDIYFKVLGYVQTGDMFLIGSDGAFGRLQKDEILRIVCDGNENQVLKNLFVRAREYKDDDQTAILYKVY